MATVVLRFYGRFVFAECRDADGQPNGTITALAPNFKNGGLHGHGDFHDHQPLMWIRRPAVEMKNGSTATNLAPSMRLVVDGPIMQSECFVWDLSGRTVQVRGRQIAVLPENHRIANLADLEKRKDRAAELDEASLNGSTAGKTRAAIRVAGNGTTGVAFPSVCDFVSLPDATAGTNNPATFGTKPAQFDDFVEFAIDVASDSPRLTLDLTKPDEAEFTSQITVKAAEPVTIGFSYRSSTLPISPPFDLEFGQYYELLKNPPDDRLVPREIKGGGELGDCDRLGYIPYKCYP
jgi:hypothetical protein